MNIALVHEFLVTWGGSDLVARTFCEIFPGAPLYTALLDEKVMRPYFPGIDIRTSFLQKVPFALKKHRLAMPFFPLAFEGFDLSGYDVVLSSHHMSAKGVITPADTCHISFVHTPMRYAWDFYHEYMGEFGRFQRPLMRLLFHYLRMWDYASAARVDYFVANSHNVARRIMKHYRRESAVIHSPVEAHKFKATDSPKDYYLVVSRLVPYKRVDIAVEAFSRIGEKLVVAGTGPELDRLKAMAGKNVEFAGFVPDEQLADLYSGCRAFLFPGYEDFGITPLEAQASGRPVIAYGAGGALETIEDGATGCFFPEQKADSLAEAVKNFDWGKCDQAAVRAHALKFDIEEFKKKILVFVTGKSEEWKNRTHCR